MKMEVDDMEGVFIRLSFRNNNVHNGSVLSFFSRIVGFLLLLKQ